MHRFRPLIKVTAPALARRSSVHITLSVRCMATVAVDNMPSATRPNMPRQLSTTSGDYDLSYTPDVRKSLGTYGLTPPAVESFDVQTERCKPKPCGRYHTPIADFAPPPPQASASWP